MSDTTGPNAASNPTQPGASWRRREFLTAAAATGAVVWTTPMILSRPAYAADGGGGTPTCRPTFTLECVVYDCQQGQKRMPGFRVVTSACPCSPTTPPERPTTCIKITDLEATCTPDPVAFGSGTLCGPNSPVDQTLSTGDWECFNAAFPVFFGRPRSGGSIPEIPNNCTFTFKLGVWVGDCPDADSANDAFICRTYNVTIVWNQGSETADCTFTPAPEAESLCTNVPPDESPCGSCP